ncbi:hypothetical protein [Shinella oryzae]|uniref:hypothetical protein n=1 Tax=Shinella oryzae TaxID=2871820 RepID=UPI001FF3E7C3|nr:hypothetical protein [Shinella oryzae]UPA25360.1 hypothetical protein K6301_03920 [Shinella oryzae]
MWTYISQFLTYENLNFAIGFIGTALALWSVFKGRVARRFLYARHDTTIIGATDETYNEKLEIHFDGQVIPRLTKTTMTFWNDAGKTVEHKDIAPADRLRLSLPSDAKIISASLTHMTTPANNAKIEIGDGGEVFIDFDYLDVRQGFKLSCLHTGKRRAARVNGTLKGLGAPQDDDTTSGLGVVWFLIKFFALIGTIVALGFAAAFGVNHLLDQYLNTFFKVVISGICLISVFVGVLMLLDRLGFLDGKRRHPRFPDDETLSNPNPRDDLLELEETLQSHLNLENAPTRKPASI